jgi:hypothetical protein
MWLTFYINTIANSMDTFMNFNISDLKFINSCRVMAPSLETLVNKLISNNPYEHYEHCNNMLK